MLKAWNTGHPGGITTLHANSDRSGLYRLEQLIQEAVVTVPRHFIADAIDVIVFIEGRGAAVSSHRDHRLAMALAVAGLVAEGETLIQDTDCVADSFPGFGGTLGQLRAGIGLTDI